MNNQERMDPSRYRKQIRFQPIGEEGQRKLQSSRIAIVGVGALGSIIAERMARAGVGYVRLIDRDWVEWDNLPRQSLYLEADVQNRLPKAIAAKQHLERIDSSIQIDAHVQDLTYRNAFHLLDDVDLILDGSDNFEVRFLINDFAHETNTPWVHGGCVGAAGQVMLVVPHQTPCFRCIVPELPPIGSQETCDTAGVVGPAVTIVGSWQCIEAIKYLTGNWTPKEMQLLAIDTWHGDLRKIHLQALMKGERCVACQGDRSFLTGKVGGGATVLCGRNAIQIHPPSKTELDLEEIAQKLQGFGPVFSNAFFVRVESNEAHSANGTLTATIFRDGRAVIGGTEEESLARAWYARWIGC